MARNEEDKVEKVRAFIKKHKLGSRTSVEKIMAGFTASKGVLKETLKVKNQILTLEERNSGLGLDFEKKHLRKLEEQLERGAREVRELETKIKEMNGTVEKAEGTVVQKEGEVGRLNVEKKDKEELIEGLRLQIREREAESIRLRKEVVVLKASLEQVEVRKKELFNEKNVNSKWGGKKWDDEQEHLQFLEDAGEKRVQDLGKSELKELLIRVKADLAQVKEDLLRVSGNLNNQDFIEQEKSKVHEIKSAEVDIRQILKSTSNPRAAFQRKGTAEESAGFVPTSQEEPGRLPEAPVLPPEPFLQNHKLQRKRALLGVGRERVAPLRRRAGSERDASGQEVRLRDRGPFERGAQSGQPLLLPGSQ